MINTPAGSIVQANVTVLANVVQVNPIAVSFNLPQRDLADFLAAASSAEQVKVTATLPEDKKPMIGKLQFVDNAVDPASGTVKLKAVFKVGVLFFCVQVACAMPFGMNNNIAFLQLVA